MNERLLDECDKAKVRVTVYKGCNYDPKNSFACRRPRNGC
ncbi:hypothetical protein VCR4J2_280071 [Vibrio coralliirubri]|nr:hypothetical protein VCR4J2_280071 [Vibrio coralliirubri]CDT59489.1 hypothetical protein VCR29J2_360780 [Vibrio coralliirubri]